MLGSLVGLSGVASATTTPVFSGDQTYASNLAATSATLNSVVNPEGVTTTFGFCYATSTFTLSGSSCPAGTTSATSSTGSSSVSIPISLSANITSLTSNTDYYFAAYATQGGTTTWSALVDFMPPSGGSYSCTSTIYFTTSTGLNSYNASTNAFTAIGTTSSKLDGVGYDDQDNLIYGWSTGGDLYELDPNGAEHEISSTAYTNVSYQSGDFIPNSSFMLTGTSNNLDIDDVTSPTRASEPLTAPTSNGSATMSSVYDIAMNTQGSYYVGYGMYGNKLYQISIPVSTITNNSNSASWTSSTFTGAAKIVEVTASSATNAPGTSDIMAAAMSDAGGDVFFFDYTSNKFYEITAAHIATAFPSPGTTLSGGAAGNIMTYLATATSQPLDGAACVSAGSAFAPTVTTSAATSVTSSSITLNGTAGANGSAISSTQFIYSTSPTTTSGALSGTTVTATPSPALSSSTTQSYTLSTSIGSLLPGTTYYFQAVATNGTGTNYGSVISVTTGAAVPTVTTSAASSTTETTATLNGSITANGAATSVTFCYSLSNTTTAGALGSCLASGPDAATTGSPTSSSASGAGVTYAASGLSAGTTYYFQAIGNNSAGTTYGSVLSFMTASQAVVPAVITSSAANPVGVESATLNGTVTANGEVVSGVEFCYSTTAFTTGNCTGTTVAATPGTTVSGVTPESLALGSLSPGQTYYAELEATGSVSGALDGGVVSFTTANAAAVTSTAANPVGVESATLNGSVNAGGETVHNAQFCYSTTAFTTGTCTGTTVAATPGTTVNGVTPESSNLSSLTPGQTYYAELEATGTTSGALYGGVVNFTTGNTAVLTSTAANPVGVDSATLNGSLSAGGETVSNVEFCYSTSVFLTGNCVGTTQAAIAGTTVNGVTPESLDLTSLTPDLTYFVELEATGSVSGVIYGGVVNFTTGNTALVQTTGANPVGVTTATLNGTVTPGGETMTNVEFCYSTTFFTAGNCAGTIIAATPGATVNGVTSESADISSLNPSQLYYFTLEATGSVSGALDGGLTSFATETTAQVITTGANPIGTTTATLNGVVSAGGENVSNVEFCYSTTYFTSGNCAGTTVAATAGTTVGGSTPESLDLSSLTPGQTYYAELEATGSVSGALYGGVDEITTNQEATTTSVTSLAGDTVGLPIVISVLVAPVAGPGTPTGSVTISDGDGHSCVTPLDVNGEGSCDITETAPGFYTFNAVYGGDSSFEQSQTVNTDSSNNGSGELVSNAALTDTTTTITSLVGDTLGQPITVSVAVAPVSGPGSPTGSITISDGDGDTCVATLSSGTASCQITETTPGLYTFNAVYGGDSNFNGSQTSNTSSSNNGSSETLSNPVVSLTDTTTTITGLSGDTVGQPTTVTVHVAPTSGTGSPTGSVTISDGDGHTCVATVGINGTASCQITETTPGTYTFNAVYGGDSNFNGSQTSNTASSNNGSTETIPKLTQALAFTSTPPAPGAVGTTYTPALTSGASGEPVVLVAGPSSVCTISGGVVTFVGVGTCTITATQAGDAQYAPGGPVTQTITVIHSQLSPPIDVTTTTSQSGTSTTVTWQPPANDGGSPIIGYKVIVSPGGMSCTTTGALSCVVNGLTPGTTYDFKVSALTAKGQSPEATGLSLILVPFVNNSAKLTTSMMRLLNQAAAAIKADHYHHVTFVGYASSTGTKSGNDSLGVRRSRAAARYLLSRLAAMGVTNVTIEWVGKGASKFAVANTKAAVNRRVVVVVH
ncbi:MAG: Ig-like domain repeat protein [Acidimicrobiales bacterium]